MGRHTYAQYLREGAVVLEALQYGALLCAYVGGRTTYVLHYCGIVNVQPLSPLTGVETNPQLRTFRRFDSLKHKLSNYSSLMTIDDPFL